jgi:beta-xylosidase
MLQSSGKELSPTKNTFENPVLWADVPDPSVIRVGDVYYMSSTTMHMNPGVPIMKSYDLVQWKIVNYVYTILGDGDQQTLRNGQNEYGAGSWASSLKYYNGIFYVAFASNTIGETYIFQTDDIECGPWTKSTLEGHFHDSSLLFDDGHVYLVYGSHNIKVIELTADVTAIKEGGLHQVIIPEASLVAGPDVGLPAEGAHIHKVHGQYYVCLITWPEGGKRTQLVFRADRIDGPYEEEWPSMIPELPKEA